LESSKNKSQNVSVINDTLNTFFEQYESKQKEVDSINKSLQNSKQSLKMLTKNIQLDKMNLKQSINNAKSAKKLEALAKQNGISLDSVSALDKKLASIKTLSFGRSIVNYSELTAQNIMVTGLNVEYNPSYYAAVLVGKIDYRFRDFRNLGTIQNKQDIAMVRFGFGDIEKRAIIFSYFNGRKSNNNFSSGISNNLIQIMGYAVETTIKKNENNFISAEFAKSTKPIIANTRGYKLTSDLSKFSDNSNMGLNFKAQTFLEPTKTKFSGFFRKTGENFQSFSLFSYNRNQTAWSLRVDQPFYRNKLFLSAMLRRNDFSNPFLDKTFKSSTIFQTYLLNIRIPKYPVLSLGYYPSSQIYSANNDILRESIFKTLNASITHSFKVNSANMSSTLVFNKYFSEATDSSFLPINGVNIFATQTVLFKKFQLQGSYALNNLPSLQFNTIDITGEYYLKSYLQASLGIKSVSVQNGEKYWGQSFQLRSTFGSWGGLQLQYEKSYLPTLYKEMAPIEIGRLSYFKRF
jgi:hypothetical protein